MTDNALRDRTAIVGVGSTPFTRRADGSVARLAAEASIRALGDAGLRPADIDGLVTYIYSTTAEESLAPSQLASLLGIPECTYEAHLNGGGGDSCTTVATAAMAVSSGLCKTALLYFVRKGGSQRNRVALQDERMKQNPRGGISAERQWDLAYGVSHAAVHFGKPFVAHMARFGSTSLDLAHLAVATRRHAIVNTKAMMRDPLTVEQHQQSPWIIYPYHLFDCCLRSDGAIALVITSADRARDCERGPVYIMAAAGSSRPGNEAWETSAVWTAARLYETAGISNTDVDFAELYDNFTGMCLLNIEGFSLAPAGQGGPWIRSGANSLDGACPVNTHGGLLSEGHFQGINHVLEAVQQLRPSGVADDLCDGVHDYDRQRCRQVRDAEIGLVCGNAGESALLLRRA